MFDTNKLTDGRSHDVTGLCDAPHNSRRSCRAGIDRRTSSRRRGSCATSSPTSRTGPWRRSSTRCPATPAQLSGADGRDHPQRRAARPRRLPHPRHPRGRRAPRWPRRSRAPTSSAGARRAAAGAWRPCSRRTGSAPASRGATCRGPPSTQGSRPSSCRASPSWSSPTSTSSPRPAPPATPTSWRAPAGCGSATSNGSPAPCSPAQRPTRWSRRPSAPTGSRRPR